MTICDLPCSQKDPSTCHFKIYSACLCFSTDDALSASKSRAISGSVVQYDKSFRTTDSWCWLLLSRTTSWRCVKSRRFPVSTTADHDTHSIESTHFKIPLISRHIRVIKKKGRRSLCVVCTASTSQVPNADSVWIRTVWASITFFFFFCSTNTHTTQLNSYLSHLILIDSPAQIVLVDKHGS